jgi:energy-coupling factor transporter ATP-binding protein EcfA2
MLDYKTVKLDDYNLEVEVGVVPNNSTSDFLSKLKVGSTVAKSDYEEFLLSSLIKNFTGLVKQIDSLADAQEKNIVRLRLLETIYQLNSKLKPSHIVIHDRKLLHRMDSIRLGGPSEPVLTMNPGWLDSARGDTQVFAAPVQDLLDNVWEELKKDTSKDYTLKKVNVLEMDLPILVTSSVSVDLDDLIVDFLFKKCDGNLFLAKHDQRLWIGYVLALTIPHIEKIIYALAKSNYMEAYTENVIYTQMYMAVLKVNPELNWEIIDWDAFQNNETTQEPPDEPRMRRISSKTPLTRQRPRSSRQEAEEEKPKFRDIPYEKVLGLPKEIKTRIIGQDSAVDSVCESIAVARVGLRGDKKPVGTFLFAGKTGVGKTELAKVLADVLTDHEPIRIDCSEYQQAHEISKIFGAPPGYVGFEDDGKHPNQGTPPTTVASKLRDKPFSVVLFDEIEKADPAINNVLLQIMDEGHVTSGRGETISFNNAVVILTSNVGTAEAEEACAANKLGFGEDARDMCSLAEETISAAIKERFKPEFRNRLTETVIFNSLDKATCKGIVDVLLNKTKENLEKAQHVTMNWDDSLRDFVLKDGFSDEFGAREMERVIAKHVELPLAKYILEHQYLSKKKELTAGSIINLSMKNDKLVFNIKDSNNEKADTKRAGLPHTENPLGRKSRSGNNKS